MSENPEEIIHPPVPYDRLEADMEIVNALAAGTHPESLMPLYACSEETRAAVKRVIPSPSKTADLVLVAKAFFGNATVVHAVGPADQAIVTTEPAQPEGEQGEPTESTEGEPEEPPAA